ncbi:MAG: tetratricopeptide repeat protein [Candidatus Omnitrophota bacterium]
MKFLAKPNTRHIIALLLLALACHPAVLFAQERMPATDEGKNYLDRSQHLFLQRDYDGAIELLHKLIVLEPDFEETYFYLGQAYMTKGDFDKAVYWFKESVLYEPKDEKTWRELGKAYERKGDFVNAAKNYYICLDINPKDIETKLALTIVRDKLAKQIAEEKTQSNVTMVGPNSRQINNFYFSVIYNTTKWRLVTSDRNVNNTRFSVLFESLRQEGKTPPAYHVKIYAEKVSDRNLTNVEYANQVAASQTHLQYTVLFRDRNFWKFNTVKDVFSIVKEGKLFKGIAMYLAKDGVGCYVSASGPADNYEDTRGAFQEFLDNFYPNF